MTLLCPVLKGYIHKSKNYRVFKLIVIEQNSEFCFDFLLVAAPGFFLILPWSHKVMLLEQTSCTFSKGGLCLYLQLVEVKGRDWQATMWGCLEWTERNCNPFRAGWCDVTLQLTQWFVGVGSWPDRSNSSPMKKGEKPSQGRKLICPYTAMLTLWAAEGPQPCIRSNSDSAGPFGSLLLSLICSIFH